MKRKNQRGKLIKYFQTFFNKIDQYGSINARYYDLG